MTDHPTKPSFLAGLNSESVNSLAPAILNMRSTTTPSSDSMNVVLQLVEQFSMETDMDIMTTIKHRGVTIFSRPTRVKIGELMIAQLLQNPQIVADLLYRLNKYEETRSLATFYIKVEADDEQRLLRNKPMSRMTFAFGTMRETVSSSNLNAVLVQDPTNFVFGTVIFGFDTPEKSIYLGLHLDEIEPLPTGNMGVSKSIFMAPVDRLKCARSCFACSKVSASQRCTACKFVPYCSRDCQKQDWHQHKLICKRLQTFCQNGPFHRSLTPESGFPTPHETK